MTREQFIREISGIQGPLRRFLLSLCSGDAAAADDIAQDACVKAWLSLDGFRDQSKLQTWVFRIAYNSWYDSYRKSGARPCGLDASEVRGLADTARADDAFRYEALYAAIEQLGPSEKAAVLLFYMEDKSIREISSILGMPSGTVKSLLSRGRAKLKFKLK